MRIERVRRETEVVTSVLSGIFTTTEDPDSDPIPELPIDEPAAFEGLDRRHATLLDEILGRETWSRADMEALCRGFELLPDGAIETLNEWSFDRFDAAIIEDGDPLFVQYDVLARGHEEGGSMTTSKIKTREKDTIVQALNAGVVPRLGLQHLQVGRASEIQAMIRDVERLCDGGAAFRLIIGEYGSGKTFFLNLVRLIALERKLVVASADLGPDRRLHASAGHARSLYAELMRNLSTRTKPNGGALASVVERFVSDAHKAAGRAERAIEDEIDERLAPLQDLVSGVRLRSCRVGLLASIGSWRRRATRRSSALAARRVRHEDRSPPGLGCTHDHRRFERLRLFEAHGLFRPHRRL